MYLTALSNPGEGGIVQLRQACGGDRRAGRVTEKFYKIN